MSEQQSSRFSNNPNDSNSMQQHDPTANQAQSAPTHCAAQGNAATGVAQGNARNGIAGNAPNATSAMAIAGLVLGLIALLTSFIPIINNLSFFLALLGLIFATIGLAACVRKTRKGKGLAIAALVICIVSGVVVVGTQSIYSAALKDAASSSGASSTKAEQTTQSTESEKTPSASTSKQESTSVYAVTIDDCTTATDYKGKPAAVVTYTFTNNSDEARSFVFTISAKAFQNGVELENAIGTGINSQDIMKEIKPGNTITVQEAYVLDDETAEITVECSELMNFDKSILTEKTFAL